MEHDPMPTPATSPLALPATHLYLATAETRETVCPWLMRQSL
ncbi:MULTISPECIES: hypothetical protein [unclassified Haloarcula]|nr:MULTISPECIES: hypothetical protein [Haloarcula]